MVDDADDRSSLSKLQGDFTLEQSQLEIFHLPSLTESQTIIIQSNPRLETIHLPLLERVKGNFHIGDNPRWKGLDPDDLGALAVIEGSFVLSNPPIKMVRSFGGV
jgi:hypothetical protein